MSEAGNDYSELLNPLLARYDAPAFVRRARGVEEALEELRARCLRQRVEWLRMARLQLGTLWALAGDWIRLRPWLADDRQADVLAGLHQELDPRPRLPVAPTASLRKLRRALRDVVDSLTRFNRRWLSFLAGVDRTPVNELRERYNRYYLLEKECSLRSAALARRGFVPLGPLTAEELLRLLPPLPVPQMK
jgi:hypothetical protein